MASSGHIAYKTPTPDSPPCYQDGALPGCLPAPDPELQSAQPGTKKLPENNVVKGNPQSTGESSSLLDLPRMGGWTPAADTHVHPNEYLPKNQQL